MYAAHCMAAPAIQFGENSWEPIKKINVAGSCATRGGFSAGVNDYAYCVLPEVMTGFPYTPPAMGCERDVKAGQPVFTIGFGTGFDPAKPTRAGYKRWSRAGSRRSTATTSP